MSVKVMSWVWDHSRAEGIDRLVLLAIADQAGHDGADAWPTIPTLARKCNVSERTVQRSIKALVLLAELEVEQQKGGRGDSRNDRRPNRYRVCVERGVRLSPPSADGVTPQVERGDSGGENGVTLLSQETSEGHVLPRPLAPTAPARAKGPKFVPATQPLVKAWYDSKDPKPAQPYPAILKAVDALLRAGYSTEAVLFGLDRAPTVSVGAIEFAINQAGPRMSRSQDAIGRVLGTS